MDEREKARLDQLSAHSGASGLTTGELLQQLRADAKDLFKMEVELAKAEAKMDIDSEVDLAKGAVVAIVCSLLGVNMLIVAAVFALAPKFAWIAALVVGIVLLVAAAVAGGLGWSRAQKHPLDTTRATLMEDVEWAKQQRI
jgi:uncharacterized membrane protein YqjE